MAIDLSGVVTWLKGWFYEKSEVYKKEETYSKSEVNNALSGKLNSNLVTANKMLVTGNNGDVELADKPVIPDISGKIDTAGTGLSKSGTTLNHSNSITAQTSPVFKKFKYDNTGHITGTSDVGAYDLPSHNHSISNIISLQSELDGLDTRIDSLESIKAIEVVSTLPTASSSTMNRLYIISENSKINVYYTEQNGSSYAWHKMDSDILDELSLDWSEIENNPFSSSTPSSFATSGHSHGNISNDGLLSIRDASGEIKTLFVGMSSTTANRLVWTDKLDSEVIKNTVALGNIGTGVQASQKAINTAINTAIGTINTNIASKQDIGDCITSIELVPKSDDSTGAIRLYYGDEE